jgi:LCP family protein required for cell wall assembly
VTGSIQQRFPRSRPPRRSPLLLATTIASIMVIALSAVAWAGFTTVTKSIKREDVFAGIEERPDRNAGSAVTFLLVGSDTREGLTKKELSKLRVGSTRTAAGKRSDTMILAHINKDRDQAVLVSIPRDSFATVPEWIDSEGKVRSASAMKLNATFAYGGASLTIRTIEAMTELRIDHYIEVNFAGFAKMVDALGGVEICTKSAIKDENSHLQLPSGLHQLDGITALKYVRARSFDGTGDIGRMSRQQKFLGAMLREATSSGTLLNPVRLVSFINAALKTVTTDPDLNRDDLVVLATQLRNLSPSRVTFLTVPLSDLYYNSSGVRASVLWDPELAPELWRRLREGEPVTPPKVEVAANALTVEPSAIKIAVLNGTTRSGLASTAITELTKIGFASTSPAANGKASELTTITYDPQQAQALKTLLAALPGAKAVAVKGHGPVFTITLGADFQAAVPVKLTPAAVEQDGPFKVQTAEDSC